MKKNKSIPKFKIDLIVHFRAFPPETNVFVSALNTELQNLVEFIASAPRGVEVVDINIFKPSINH